MIRNNYSWIEVDHSNVKVCNGRGSNAGLEIDLPDGKRLLLRIESADLIRLAYQVRKREEFSADTKAFRKRSVERARKRCTKLTRQKHT